MKLIVKWMKDTNDGILQSMAIYRQHTETMELLADKIVEHDNRLSELERKLAEREVHVSQNISLSACSLEAQAEILRMAEELRERRSTAERMMEAP